MENSRCMNCFAELKPENGGYCPVCGWDTGRAQIPGGLAYGTVLSARYLIGRAKAKNGEGISYAAWDQAARRTVELREFFPTAIAVRDPQLGEVLPKSGREGDYARLLDKFLELSKGISRLRELSVVVTVLDIFTEKNTAYAVYEAPPVQTLRRYIREKGPIGFNDVDRLFMPVITGLGLINSLGIAHLGVSPESLRITREGGLFITGFSVMEARQAGTPLEAELTPGFAAEEQYTPGAVCGEVSDVYALAACMLFALTGQAPEPAPARLKDQRLMISREVLKGLPPFTVTAIANALQVRAENRTSSFERFRAELRSAPTIVNEVEQTDAIRRLPIGMEIGHRGMPPTVWLLGSLVITLAALFIIASAWMGQRGMSFGDLGKVFHGSGQVDAAHEAPTLLGQSYEEWEKRLAEGDYDFTLRVSERIFNDTVEEGKIISQSILPGDEVEPGGEIIVTVSKGSATRTLPEVKGMSYEALEAILKADGFVPSRVDEASDGVEAGYVIRYEGASEGDSLDYGSAVTVVVSAGPAA